MEMPSSPARAVRRAKSSALPSSGLQRHVPARLAADGPGAAGVGAPRGRRVVAALAVRQPDRVDGRQVEHVEAELGELRQQLLDSGEAAPRAREELVPGSERRRARNPRGPRGSRRRPSARSGRRRPPPGPPRPSATRRRAEPRPPRARSRGRSGRPRPCAPARAARRPRGRPMRPRRTASARARRPRTSRASDRGPRGGAASAARASDACPGARKRRAPPSTSCPSRRNVAHTSTRSPTVRLAG